MSKPFFLYNPTYTIYDSTGAVVPGAQVVTMQAGTTTLQTTYPTLADALASTNANTNPIVANAAGIVGPIWSTVALKVIETTAADTTPWNGAYRTRDNITSLGQVITSQTKTTGTYTVDNTYKDKLNVCDASGGALTFNLPTAASFGDGGVLRFKKSDGTASTVTITPNGAENLDGAASSTILLTQNDYCELVCDGTQWFLTSRTGESVSGTSFIVRRSSTANNVTGDSTAYTIAFDDADVDTASGWSTNTYTIPTSGNWLLGGNIVMNNVAAHTGADLNLTGTHSVILSMGNPGVQESSVGQYAIPFSVFKAFTAGDTVSVRLTVSGGALDVDVVGHATTDYSTFWGRLIV